MATSKDSHTMSYIPQILNISSLSCWAEIQIALRVDSYFLVGIIRKTNYILAHNTMLVPVTRVFPFCPSCVDTR